MFSLISNRFEIRIHAFFAVQLQTNTKSTIKNSQSKHHLKNPPS